MKVAIVTDDPGWHGARLARAFAGRGGEARTVALSACRLELGLGHHGVLIPGFEPALPDGVFVRGVAGGTLEQVTVRLDVLHALREIGIPVYNDARAVERSVDKAMTSFLLTRAGIPTPPTWVCESREEARAVLHRETEAGQELVMKPLFGSQGAGLQRLRSGMDIPDSAAYNAVHYLQRFVHCGEAGFHDWRVLVVGGRVAAAMIRRGATWINNVAQGARCESCQPDDQLRRMAEGAARAVDMDYAGVDLMRDRDGCAWVLEVNSMPAWKGLQSVTETDIAQRLVDDFVDRRIARCRPVAA